ncbi:MAG: hypothetical protein OJJ55_23560 [Rhodococcus sp.]|uniref:hypothetical protein n=1 Tax=Rhodococcus TaxID=1827 RepID=UPI001AE6853C|nr:MULTISPECIES: hypothetical protein [Rhodococcus]MBP2521023.1 hypothetical protein [Rhodococcus sp. PvP104]MBY6389513.1 hypothetical protein [Rhodococcus erythropolis]MCW0194271.1 hypothetical protein [Rhodococcus sp. (in: high G+C Gram-positive bacteria)]
MTSPTDNAVVRRFAHAAFALAQIVIGVVLGAIAWNFSGRIAPSSWHWFPQLFLVPILLFTALASAVGALIPALRYFAFAFVSGALFAFSAFAWIML